MRTSAISLLQGNVPHIRHIGKAGQKKAGSLYSRMVWLNMISDKNRVIVSVASIAGCCALLVAGFSMKYSVTKAFNRQYDEIELYDMKVSLDPDSAASAAEKLQTRLKEAGVEWTEISDQTLMFNVGGKLNAAEVMCGDIPEMNQFFAMHDIRTNKLLSGEGEGIWIHKRTAEKNDLKAGDTIINEGGITTNEFKSGDTIINEGGITTNNITTENIDASTIETKNINVTENITYKGDHIVTNVTYDGDTNTLVVNKGDETNNYVLKDTTYEGDNKTIQISEDNVISVIEGNVAEGDTGVVTGDTVYNETRVHQDGNYIRQEYTAAENITAKILLRWIIR